MSGSPTQSLPPAEDLVLRIVRQGHTSGRLTLWLAGLYAVLCATNHDVIGAITGCAAAGAGALAVHATGRLHVGDPQGLELLTRSQLLLLATILLFVAARMLTLDAADLAAQMTPEMRTKLATTPLTEAQFLDMVLQMYRLGYVILGVVSLLRIGLRLRFYASSKPAVEKALGEEA
jgi:hypothetical protein